MAKATTFTRKITHKVVQEVVTEHPNYVELNLKPEEAAALFSVLSNVGGHPDTTPRGLTDSIYEALQSAGVKRHPKARFTTQNVGGLYFI